MKQYEIDSSKSTALNKENEVTEQSQQPKRSTVPKRREVQTEEYIEKGNIFKDEALEVREQIVSGLTNAWNSIEPDEISDFEPKDMLRALIIPTVFIILYYILPIDIVPDGIPIVGDIDDFVIGQIILVSGFKRKYKKMTGEDLDVKQVLSGRKTILIFIEHIITSILQSPTLAIGDFIVAPMICTFIDLCITLYSFYKVAFRNCPDALKKLLSKSKKKNKSKKKKKLLKGDALK